MKFTLGVIVGAIVGGAVVHYCNTYEGKALGNRIKDDADQLSDNISGLADDIVAAGRKLVGKAEPVTEETVVVVVPGTERIG